MQQDPKQIVTPYAFSVDPDLLGLPLASPSRRLIALLLDLAIASVLTALSKFIVAIVISILFFFAAMKTRGGTWWKNVLRFGSAAFFSLIVFAFTIHFIEDNPDEQKLAAETTPEVVTAEEKNVNWKAITGDLQKMENLSEEEKKNKILSLVDSLDNYINTRSTTSENFLNSLPENFDVSVRSFLIAIEMGDSLKVDSLRGHLAAIIAGPEIARLEDENDRLDDIADDLEDENEDLIEEIENPSSFRVLEAGFSFMGLTLGWVGIYFIVCIAYFNGYTLGKRLLGIRVARLDNQPIGLWYSFERFGGYAAGLATGLVGFFQIYWDPNRQAIHDKISATVVLDTRKKKLNKTADLRKYIRDKENLID